MARTREFPGTRSRLLVLVFVLRFWLSLCMQKPKTQPESTKPKSGLSAFDPKTRQSRKHAFWLSVFAFSPEPVVSVSAPQQLVVSVRAAC